MNGRFPSGAAIEVFETLDSTSLEAKRRAGDGACGPLWIVALEQTNGYGRRGSAWTQRAGDIAATFLFDPREDPERLGEISFVAGLSVAEAILHFAPRADLTLKWPNDVLLEGGKAAGILLELVDGAAGRLLAFGVGVNVVSKPDNVDYPTARLIDHVAHGVPPSPREFVRVLDGAFGAWMARRRADGFEPVRRAWLARGARLGEKIRVRLPNGPIEGIFADLDHSGALVLECDGTRRLISAGAVFPAAQTP